ncbi:MAG TPA: HDOD domain-containing protein [Gemmataceae bacterium]|nr:HDOD domain-containing protein [Gemmataceae bacterium]
MISTRASIAPSPVETRSSGDGQEVLLERILQNPRIPSPPNLALQIFQKTGQEDSTIQEISELLTHDPGLSAKILKALNSAVYGRSHPVTSVRQAVTMMGSRPLRSLILGLALPVMQKSVEADAGLRRFWRKSVAGAVMARELATRCNFPAPDDELAACLLRDLGMILLRQMFQEMYRPIWTVEGEIFADEQCVWEERHFGVHHAEVSAALLERWRLPMEFVEPIRFHHHPELVPPVVQLLVDRAYLLDFITRLTDLEEPRKVALGMEGILQRARERFGLERVDLEQFLSAVRPKIEEFTSILGVDIGACPDFDELLATQCEEMVRLSLEAASVTTPNRTTTGLPKTVDQSLAAVSNLVQDLLDDPGKLAPGFLIHKYEVMEFIGRGAMGIVLKALDPGLARHVAIKLLAPELASSEKARQRFALEARYAAAIRHEHVVTIFAVSEFDGIPSLIMEYVRGTSLEDQLEASKTFSIREIAQIGRQSALGLAAAHALRLIHRDIKPANILLEEGTHKVRITDFGLARAMDEDFHLSQKGLLIGTPNFMSPEQVDGKTLTPASDLFGLGSVLYTLCTGELPFQAETMSGLLCAVAERSPTPIRGLNPNIPEGLAEVIEKMHEKDPLKRIPTATAVAELLKPWCK